MEERKVTKKTKNFASESKIIPPGEYGRKAETQRN